MPYITPRGVCPVCGRQIALTLAGRLRVHRADPMSNCGGSGRMPKTNADKEN